MTKQSAYVRTARWEDVPIVADNMRQADVAEITALSGNSPREALSTGIRHPSFTACLPNGIPCAMYGVVDVGQGVGAVWMLATDQLEKHSRQFLRETRDRIEDLGEGYRVLMNVTDARNTVHHRWIKWAGFTIIKRHEELGVERRPFLEFVRIMEA